MLRELVLYFNIGGREISSRCNTTAEVLELITSLEKLGLSGEGKPHRGTMVGCTDKNSYGIMACINGPLPRRISKKILEEELKGQKVIPYGTTT